MASYRDKVKADLDRWISAGLVPADNRAAILESIPKGARLDAATALAWVGGLLLGIAVIAFVAANWDTLSRVGRFALVLGAFAIAAGGGAWAAHKNRPVLANIALMLAALIFAAAIALTGQIFDIAGDERAALYASGIAGMALALAGRSTGAAAASLVLFGLGDFQGFEFFNQAALDLPWLIVAAPLGIYLALRWSSATLAHIAAIGVLVALFWFAMRFENDAALALLFSIALAGMAAAARWLARQDKAHASIIYGWAAWGALMFFAIAGYADAWSGGQNWGVVHRIAWLTAAGGLIALGRHDSHGLVTTVGVLGMLGAIACLLADLGLDLMTAAGIFLLCALIALVGGLLLRRSKAKAT